MVAELAGAGGKSSMKKPATEGEGSEVSENPAAESKAEGVERPLPSLKAAKRQAPPKLRSSSPSHSRKSTRSEEQRRVAPEPIDHKTLKQELEEFLDWACFWLSFSPGKSKKATP